MVRLIWAESAVSDLDAIADYIALENASAARRLIAKIHARVGQLRDHPASGRAVPELAPSRYRELIEPPCRIIYRQDGSDQILIVYVRRMERMLPPGT